MDPFPTELWQRIIKNLKIQDWLAVATTCRFLHSVAEPDLYHTVNFVKMDLFKKNKFYQSLAARPGLGALVRTFSIALYPEDTIPQHFPLFPNLLELELWAPEVNATFLTELFDVLPHLRAITIFQPNIEGNLVVPHHVQGIPLRSLRINGQNDTTTSLLGYFKHCRHNYSLTTLTIDDYGDIPNALLPFLLSTPSLLHLSLGFSAPAPTHLIHTPPHDAIPLLAHFSGYATCAPVFVLGRPVSSVKLHMEDTPADDVLRLLEGSAVPITALSLNCPGPWLRYAPQTLQYLNWGNATKEALLTSIPIWAPMPGLERTSGFVSEPASIPVQEDIMRAVSATYPSVRECLFRLLRFGHEGDDVWVRLRDGRWECRMRVPSLE